MDESTTFKLIDQKDITQSIIHKVTSDSSQVFFLLPCFKYEYKVWNGVQWLEHDELQETIEVKPLSLKVMRFFSSFLFIPVYLEIIQYSIQFSFVLKLSIGPSGTIFVIILCL